MLHVAAGSNQIFGKGPVGQAFLRAKARCPGSATGPEGRETTGPVCAIVFVTMAADYPAGVIAGLWRVRYNRWFVCRSEKAN